MDVPAQTLWTLARLGLGDKADTRASALTQVDLRKLELAGPHAGELAADMARGAPAKTALVTVGAMLAGAMLVGRLRRGGSRHAV